MADHLEYPDFSTHVLTDIVGIARSGDLMGQLPLAGKCAWEIAGAGLKLTVGEPADHGPVFGASAELQAASVEEIEEAISALETLNQGTFGANVGAKAINPFVLMLIQAALAALMELLAKKNQGS